MVSRGLCPPCQLPAALLPRPELQGSAAGMLLAQELGECPRVTPSCFQLLALLVVLCLPCSSHCRLCSCLCPSHVSMPAALPQPMPGATSGCRELSSSLLSCLLSGGVGAAPPELSSHAGPAGAFCPGYPSCSWQSQVPASPLLLCHALHSCASASCRRCLLPGLCLTAHCSVPSAAV